jgi:DNA-binding NtrC family response regulator
MDRTRFLVIHPDPSTRATIASMLAASGHDFVDETSPEAMYHTPPDEPGLLLLGLDRAGADVLGFLISIRRRYPSVPVILLATADQPDRMMQSLRLCATSVLRFPLPASQLQAAVLHALDATEACLRQESDSGHGPSLGGSAAANESSVVIEQPAQSFLSGAQTIPPLRVALEGPEREIILRTLRACGWSRSETAKVLDINRTPLYKKMKKNGLFGAY